MHIMDDPCDNDKMIYNDLWFSCGSLVYASVKRKSSI